MGDASALRFRSRREGLLCKACQSQHLVVEGAVEGDEVDARVALQTPRIGIHLGGRSQQLVAGQLALPMAVRVMMRAHPAASEAARMRSW